MAEEKQTSHCRDCGGTELYDTVLSARNGVIVGRKTRTGDEWILVRCLICLKCGFIMPYLDNPGVERLRAWAYEAAPPTDYPGADTPETAVSADGGSAVVQEKERGFGTIVVLCVVVGALLGILGAIYGLTHE
ncbi:MAG: hypothetical protein ACAH83_13150 [Alphaproteobacteria bacterium]